METLRYNFKSVNTGLKARSSQTINRILSVEEERRETLRRYKGLTLDKPACIHGKTGIVRRMAKDGSKLLVWLEIQLTRGARLSTGVYSPSVVHLGLELPIK